MSQQWKGDRIARYWQSPIGEMAVLLCGSGRLALEMPRAGRVMLERKTMKAACLEAERIIAERCRETLKMLGET